MNALVQYEDGKFDVMQRAAKALAESGYFADAKSLAQAVVKVMAGAELGLAPFASMAGIHIIQGRPALGANVIATLIKNDPRYDYRVVELTDAVCRIQFYENGQACGVSEFTATDAKKAGTKNMDRYAKNMLFARAMSNGAKWFVPGVFGGAPIYTPEELGADVDGDGDIVEGVLVETAQPAKATRPAVAEVEPEPEMPGDETAIYDTPAKEFWGQVIHLIDRYSHVKAAQNAARKLGYGTVPIDAMKRVEMYRAIRDHAAVRDAEEAGEGAEQPALIETTGGGAAYAE